MASVRAWRMGPACGADNTISPLAGYAVDGLGALAGYHPLASRFVVALFAQPTINRHPNLSRDRCPRPLLYPAQCLELFGLEEYLKPLLWRHAIRPFYTH